MLSDVLKTLHLQAPAIVGATDGAFLDYDPVLYQPDEDQMPRDTDQPESGATHLRYPLGLDYH